MPSLGCFITVFLVAKTLQIPSAKRAKKAMTKNVSIRTLPRTSCFQVLTSGFVGRQNQPFPKPLSQPHDTLTAQHAAIHLKGDPKASSVLDEFASSPLDMRRTGL